MSKTLSMAVFFLTAVIIVLPSLIGRGCNMPAGALPLPRQRSLQADLAEEVNIRLFRAELGEVVTLPLDEYLVGVVAAEMPASFAPEALKAQAVVARTYAVSRLAAFGGQGCSRHPGADICDDFAHCQAWEPEEKSLAKWPAGEAQGYLQRIRRAVQETSGQIIVAGGQPIDAVFHAHCGGHTENSEDVWTSASSYLRGVPCPYCEGSRWWETTQEFSGAQFAGALLPYVSALPVSAAGRPLLDGVLRTATGRVRTLRVGGEQLRGRDLRAALELPSTKFSWRISGDSVIFTTRGFGHGVGLCQYGADGQARAGKSYREIINFYYRGVEIVPMTALTAYK
jgi:stage II sporulation protein D